MRYNRPYQSGTLREEEYMDTTSNENYSNTEPARSEFERAYIRREVMRAYQDLQNGERGRDYREFFNELDKELTTLCEISN